MGEGMGNMNIYGATRLKTHANSPGIAACLLQTSVETRERVSEKEGVGSAGDPLLSSAPSLLRWPPPPAALRVPLARPIHL